MTATLVFTIILVFIILDFIFESSLNYLNKKNYKNPVPEILSDIYNEKEYQKNQNYLLANYKFSFVQSSFSFVLLILVLAFNFFAYFNQIITNFIDNPVWTPIVFLLTLSILYSLISIPFEYYETFIIEEKFEFNKTSKKLFWIDKAKSLLLSIVFGIIILYPVIYFYKLDSTNFWLFAWAVVTFFSLFMATFYSNLIVPLFNKQTPLENGELRNAIEAFSQKAGFKLQNIYVIDGSKRSTKANAYFTGLGKQKRIVLYDTLIKDMEVEEIVAVLAHEIGHYKHKHIIKSLVISSLYTGIILWLFGLFSQNPVFSQALGVEKPSFQIAVISLAILYSPISTFIGILMNFYSRKNEFQADAFAKKHQLSLQLISGLKKLSHKSLSNLTPHRFYTFVHYSHPSLEQRINALKNKQKI